VILLSRRLSNQFVCRTVHVDANNLRVRIVPNAGKDPLKSDSVLILTFVRENDESFIGKSSGNNRMTEWIARENISRELDGIKMSVKISLTHTTIIVECKMFTLYENRILSRAEKNH